jgi:hypothetical protein
MGLAPDNAAVSVFGETAFIAMMLFPFYPLMYNSIIEYNIPSIFGFNLSRLVPLP